MKKGQKVQKTKKQEKALNIALFAILVVLGLAVCSYTCYQIGYSYGYVIGQSEQRN